MPDDQERLEGEPVGEQRLTPEQQEEVNRLKEAIKAEEAKHQDADDGGEGYDPGQVSPPKTPVQTAFVVVVHEDGKAIATSGEDMIETLMTVESRREASIEDFRRACREVYDDVQSMLQTRSLINTQMNLARQAQEQAQTQRIAQGLDLDKMRGRG